MIKKNNDNTAALHDVRRDNIWTKIFVFPAELGSKQ